MLLFVETDTIPHGCSASARVRLTFLADDGSFWAALQSAASILLGKHFAALMQHHTCYCCNLLPTQQ